MKAADPLLKAWRKRLQADPDAPLVADGAAGRWTTRAGVEAIRMDWVERLPTVARSPVLFQCPNGPEWLGVALAIWSRGGIAVPLDPLTREAERDRLIAALRPAAVVADGTVQSFAGAVHYRAPVVLGKLTSGSTGTPKALFFTASQMIADGSQVERGMGIGPGDINLAAIPFGHSYGLGNLVFPALVEGRPVVCASAVFPRVLVEEAAPLGATVFPATPPLLRNLLRAGLSRADWPSLRLVISAGARLEPELACAFAEAFAQPVHNFYGSSETGGIAFDRPGVCGLEGRALGTALPGVNIAVSPTGRLVVASAAVYSYRNRRRLDGEPAMMLADRGEVLADGRIVLRGRTNQLLKIGARRLNPHEIEAVLKRVPGVVDCRVLLCPGGDEEILGAVIAGTPEKAALRTAAKAGLAAWKVPKRIRLVPELPATARGKVDRKALLAVLA